LLALTCGACAAERGTIGAVLAQDAERRLLVRDTPQGLSAERQGVEPGDEILLIDGRDVRGMSQDQVHDALSGEVDEPVKLTLLRGTQVLRVTLRRTEARRHRLNAAAPAGSAQPTLE
jgi:C-terminal processing protease CtpA/Prc